MPIMHIELDYLCSGARSGVAHPQAYFHRLAGSLAGRNFQVAVVKLCIRETVAEGEERLDVLRVEVSVADIDSLRILYLQIFSRVMAISRRILPALYKRDRELARGVRVAEQ